MKSAGKARNNGLYRHIRTSKEIIRNLLNDYYTYNRRFRPCFCTNMEKICHEIGVSGISAVN